MKIGDFEVIKKDGLYSTVGLSKSYEIEINLNMDIKKVETLCLTVGKAIKEGLIIEDGVLVKELFTEDVYFFKISSVNNKEFFRVIFPDSNGFYPWDIYNGVECELFYKDQIKFLVPKMFLYRFKVEEFEFKELQETVYNNAFSSILLPFEYDDGFAYSCPFRFLTSKGEVFNLSSYDLMGEGINKGFLEVSLRRKLDVLCIDTTVEHLKKLQDAVGLRDYEL